MIDVHTHAFPDAATGRAWQELAGFPAVRPGTAEDLAARMAQAGIERSVVLLFPRSRQRAEALRAELGPHADEREIAAIVAGEIGALNAWGCALAARDPRFVAFVGVNPRFQGPDEIAAGIREAHAAGARGVKIIPPAMGLYPDDPLLEPAFATAAALGLPVLSQSGSGGTAPPGERGHYGRPAAWDPVLRRHRGLRVILAHLGHGYEDELVALIRAHDTVLTDTSLRLGSPRDRGPWPAAGVRALIRRLGSERVLFGTNYPVTDPVACRARLESLGLRDEELRRIGHDNAGRLLG